MRRYTDRWRKLPIRETAEHGAFLSTTQRAVAALCHKVCEDDGTLVRMRPGFDAVELAVQVLRAKPHEAEQIRDAIAGLFEEGALVVRDGRVLVVSVVAIQEDESIEQEPAPPPEPGSPPAAAGPLTAAERAKRYRADQRRKRHADRDADRHEPSRTTVTNRHEPSRDAPSRNPVTVSRGDSQKEASEAVLERKNRETNQPNSVTGARDGRHVRSVTVRDGESVTVRDASPVTPCNVRTLAVVVDADRETRCPADLVDRADQAALFSELAASLGVDAESLRAETRSFAGYWTVGGGAGKLRRNWMSKLRQRLVERVQDGTISKSVVMRAQRPPTELQLQLEEAERREIADLTARAQAEYGGANDGARSSVAQLADGIG